MSPNEILESSNNQYGNHVVQEMEDEAALVNVSWQRSSRQGTPSRQESASLSHATVSAVMCQGTGISYAWHVPRLAL